MLGFDIYSANMKMFTFQKVGVNYVYCTVMFTIEKIGNTNEND